MLRAVPKRCGRALDVGCGDGQLARLLTARSAETLGIDVDAAIVQAAAASPVQGLSFVAADVLTHPLPLAGFDFISMVATLHHLPLGPALERCRALLRPGGVLVVVGLYRPAGVVDFAWSAAGFAASRVKRRSHVFADQQAPMQLPLQSLPHLRAAAGQHLPGSVLRRRLFFRYTLLWRKPHAPSRSL